MNDFLIEEFYAKMENLNLDVYGVLDKTNKIRTLGTDSKIIGRIFEMLVQPILEEIAKAHNMVLKTPESQTVYPDFILMDDEKSKNKIAIDVKTTYINNDKSVINFTLGSFGSYMRNNTKNIEYKYTDYSKHYVIGFVYKRNGKAQESNIFDYSQRESIECPYCDVKYFIQEKYKIAGDKPGSGSTENIGSISTKNFNDFVNGNGPFATLGQDMYDIYWKYYPKYKAVEKPYNSLDEFFLWFEENKDSVILLRNFDLEKLLEKIKQNVK